MNSLLFLTTSKKSPIYTATPAQSSKNKVFLKYKINRLPSPRRITCLLYTTIREILAGGSDDAICHYIYNNATDKYILNDILKGHTFDISSIIETKNNPNVILSSSWDKTIREWDLIEGQCIKVIMTTHTNGISKIIQLDDGRIASCSYDSTINIYDYDDTDGLIKSLKGHTNEVVSMTQLNDGKLASIGLDRKLKFWDVKKFKCLENNTIEDVECHESNGMYYNKKEDTLIIGGNGVVKIIDVKIFRVICEIKEGLKKVPIKSVIVLNTGDIIIGLYYYAENMQLIRISKDLNEMENINTGKQKPVTSIVQLEDNKFGTGDIGGDLIFWEI